MTHVFVNLTTTDLERSKAFYSAIGCDINPMFTDENAACIVWDENVFFMVLTREFFSTFTDKTLSDPHTTAQMLVALGRDSRDEVDEIVDAAVAAGGVEPKPADDLGFMYSRQVYDPDGHILEFVWMSPEAVENGPDSHGGAAA